MDKIKGMSPSRPGTKRSTVERYERFQRLVTFLSNRQEFDVAEVKQAFRDVPPGFITRLVNELMEQGWILRESADEHRWNSGRGEFSVSKWLDQKCFGVQIAASPEQDRPRERLLVHGVENLRISELMAILIRSGRPGESAVMAGEKLAKEYDGRLQDLAAAGRGELKLVSPAIEKTAYCQIMAGIELGRRIAVASQQDVLPRKICSSEAAIEFCEDHFLWLATDAKHEEFHIVTLNTKNQVIDTHQVSVGTLDASLIHPREVFRPAIKDAASSIILVHNHPSGDPTPSSEDLAVTKRLETAGETIGIDVLDHIVVASRKTISIRACR